MMYPLVRELAARDAPIRVPVAVSCRVLNFSRQAYYQWAANPVPARDWDVVVREASAKDRRSLIMARVALAMSPRQVE